MCLAGSCGNRISVPASAARRVLVRIWPGTPPTVRIETRCSSSGRTSAPSLTVWEGADGLSAAGGLYGWDLVRVTSVRLHPDRQGPGVSGRRRAAQGRQCEQAGGGAPAVVDGVLGECRTGDRVAAVRRDRRDRSRDGLGEVELPGEAWS